VSPVDDPDPVPGWLIAIAVAALAAATALVVLQIAAWM
jgi:DNA-binding transcriptional regulator of glucitol operon